MGLRRRAVATVMMLTVASGVKAQTPTGGAIHGTVVDPMQAAITNADVTVTGGT
jgi:hypothetical protein